MDSACDSAGNDGLLLARHDNNPFSDKNDMNPKPRAGARWTVQALRARS
jgi:hypothetical protein